MNEYEEEMVKHLVAALTAQLHAVGESEFFVALKIDTSTDRIKEAAIETLRVLRKPRPLSPIEKKLET